MSNGDEVLDNWEEIDEAGLTDTLQKIQQKQQDTQPQKTDSAKKCLNLPTNSTSSANSSLGVFSKNTNTTSTADPNQFTFSTVEFPTPAVAATVPMKLLQRNANSSGNIQAAIGGTTTAADLKSPLDDMTASFQPVMMMLHKPADEFQSQNYATPTNLQTVKILRRPTQSMEPRNNGIKPRQPIKTLQQREQEYAEARLRILGSAKNPEDDLGASNASNNSTASTTATVNTTVSTNNAYKSNTASPKVNQSGGKGGGGGGGNGSPLNMYNNYYNHQQQQQQQQQSNYYYMQQQKQQQQQQIPPAYNSRSMSALLPLPLPTALQHQHQHPKPQPQNQHQTWSPVVGGSVSSSALRLQQQESILRLPRGPDGSNGFQMRR
ncbi:PREDICTED: probable serine/threonine-protein kinase yakA [Bactrocera latifrons]|uniref:SUZ RNA-binding domain-containing n=1 Tax=Bactrocera latifrons TaxID=174628 RepID=A0A0K8VB44_BACLA|nr:PREDICTED: probable serine/threonine-protein kinase yakA [Bactrocera latifrons]